MAADEMSSAPRARRTAGAMPDVSREVSARPLVFQPRRHAVRVRVYALKGGPRSVPWGHGRGGTRLSPGEGVGREEAPREGELSGRAGATARTVDG